MIIYESKKITLNDTGGSGGNGAAGCSTDTGRAQEDMAQSDTVQSDAEQNDASQNETAQEDTVSGSGNTEAVANVIAETTGGALFEVEPAEPYSNADLDWTDDDSRVFREYADESLRDVELVSTAVDNWDSYDTVFIGYPIWWGIAAWPVNTFVEANDFTGKTVIPFATSSSSGMGESGRLLEELAGTGDWQEGMRFRSGVDEADVQDWVNGLGL